MKVMFVCYGNVGRSQTAKGFYNLFTESDMAESSGVADDLNDKPKILSDFITHVRPRHPEFSDVFFQSMLDKGVDMKDFERQQLTSEMLDEQYDLIVNIAEREQTPDWLRGEKVIWWDVKDPGKTMRVDDWFRTVDEIEERVKKLIEIEKSGGDFRQLDDNIDKEEN